MKKLNLLKPDVKKGFLENGTGDKVMYLKIPNELGLQELEEDVQAGASMFEEILKGAKKGLSRVVMIRSKNEEQALMAVNYLAGICNEINQETLDTCPDFEESISDDYDVEQLLSEYDVDYDEVYSEDEDAREVQMSYWTESPHRVPLIPVNELFQYADGVEQFRAPSFMSVGLPNMREHKPYWMQCTEEAIGIVVEQSMYYNTFSRLNAIMDRFQNNKQVFIIVVDSSFQEDLPFPPTENIEDATLEFVLENTADLFYANAKEEDIKKYRVNQFENWSEKLGILYNKKFPKADITEKIVSLRNPNKSNMMEKVLKYVQKESGKESGEELTKEDFAVLKKFQALGIEKEKEKSTASKLEKELIGMESVKEQVRNIVAVMKYNKYREKMGIKGACFHNAHLLIGAPGTAKTTVAKLMGAMMFEENLLPGNRFICVNGADLKGMFVGHSAPKTHQIFENNDVILIDEAYSLTSTDGSDSMDSFSQEAIAQLILEIENHPMDKLVMFAGYGGIHVSEKNNKMKQFIDSNPGLKSRINSTIYFDSYTPEEMVDIVHIQAENQKLVVDKEANAVICEYFKERVNEKNFGNGREARSLLENSMVFAASRVMKIADSKKTKKIMCEIKKEDVENAIARMRENDRMQLGKKKAKLGFQEKAAV